jgi:hypothetical protein
VDTRLLISDVAPQASKDAGEKPAQRQGTSAFTLSGLWDEQDGATVSRIEEAIVNGDLRDAILLADVLVQRCLERVAGWLGPSVAGVETLMLLLRADPGAILEFRALCERSRSTEVRPSEQDALAALLFAAGLQLQVRRVQLPNAGAVSSPDG